MAWDSTYQVLYPAVRVERVAPLASIADGTASWCQSCGLCWVVLLDGHTQLRSQSKVSIVECRRKRVVYELACRKSCA